MPVTVGADTISGLASGPTLLVDLEKVVLVPNSLEVDCAATMNLFTSDEVNR